MDAVIQQQQRGTGGQVQALFSIALAATPHVKAGRLRALGVTYLRTGLSWADSFRPNADAWFDRQMKALEDFDVTLTFCFTPEHRGLRPHHTSPPQVLEEYAEFCARMVERYAPRTPATRKGEHGDEKELASVATASLRP